MFFDSAERTDDSNFTAVTAVTENNNKRKSDAEDECAQQNFCEESEFATKISRLAPDTALEEKTYPIDFGAVAEAGENAADNLTENTNVVDEPDDWSQITTAPAPSSHIPRSFSNITAHPAYSITSEENRYYNKNQAPWNYLNTNAHDVVGLQTDRPAANAAPWLDESRARNSGAERKRSNLVISYAVAVAEIPPVLTSKPDLLSRTVTNDEISSDEIDQTSRNADTQPNVEAETENPALPLGAVKPDEQQNLAAGLNTNSAVSEATSSNAVNKDEDPYEYVDFDDDDAVDDEATLVEDESANGIGDDGELDDLHELGEVSVEELRKRFGFATNPSAALSSADVSNEPEEENTNSRPRRGRRRRGQRRSSSPALAAAVGEEQQAAPDVAVEHEAAELRLPESVEASSISILQESQVIIEPAKSDQIDDLPPSSSGLASIFVHVEATKLERDVVEVSADAAAAAVDDEGDELDEFDDDFDENDAADANDVDDDDDDDDEDDDDSDKDYVPPPKPSEIRCGVNYQAVVPEGTLDAANISAHYESLPEVVYDYVQWKPDSTDEELIVAYQMAAMKQFSLFSERGTCEMNKAISDLTPFIHHVRQNPPNHFEPFPDHEDLLRQLVISANNLRVGLQRCYLERSPRQDSSLGWLDEESQRFEEALLRFEKNFRAVARHVKTRSVRECVYFYYERKRSARYERHSSSSSAARVPTLSSLYSNSSPTPAAAAGYSCSSGSGSAAWNPATASSGGSVYNTRLRNANINVPFYRQQQQQGLLFGVNIPYPPPSHAHQRTAADDLSFGSSWTLPSAAQTGAERYGGGPVRHSPYGAAAAQQQRNSRGQPQQYFNATNPVHRNNTHSNNFHRPHLQPGLNPIHHSHEEQQQLTDAGANSNYAAASAAAAAQYPRRIATSQRQTTTEFLGGNNIVSSMPAGRPAGGKFFAPSSPSPTQTVPLPPSPQLQQQLPPINFSSTSGAGNARSNISLTTTFGLTGANSARVPNNSLSSAFSTTSSNGSAGLVGTVFAASPSTMMLADQQQQQSSLSIPTGAITALKASNTSKFFGAVTPLPNNPSFNPDTKCSTTGTFTYSSNTSSSGGGGR